MRNHIDFRFKAAELYRVLDHINGLTYSQKIDAIEEELRTMYIMGKKSSEPPIDPLAGRPDQEPK